MKAKSKKTGRVFSDRFAATALKIGIGQEIGNSANLKNKGKQNKIIEEPIKVTKSRKSKK